MTYDEAYELGIKDGKHVIELARNCVIRRDDSEILIDGQDHSPAWRKLPHGEYIHENAPEHAEGYCEAFDTTIGEYHICAESISWHYGMIILYGQDSEFAT